MLSIYLKKAHASAVKEYPDHDKRRVEKKESNEEIAHRWHGQL
jgi:cation transport regulator ChaB